MTNEQEQMERDAVTGQTTTGHEWDGIKELNFPMPRWWLYTFYATIIWAVIYMVFYPALPFVGEKGYSAGALKNSDRDNVAEELRTARSAQAEYFDRLDQVALSEITADETLLTFAYEGGRALFGDNCAPCHGTAATGAKGFPNLLDDDWLWGGDLQSIYTTVAHGVRWEADDDTRYSMMPKFLTDNILTREEIGDVVEHVLRISGQEYEAAAADRGMQIFTDNCAACHKADGSGDRSIGAPKLNDAVWLYGGDRNTLFETVAYSRFGVMPAWAGRISERDMKQLSVYVHALGGGEAMTPQNDVSP